MLKPEHVPTLSREELLAVVAELQRQIAALRAEIDELKHSGKRQAAPFAKGTRVAEPKPPGRKPGTGTFHDRETPPPEAIPEPLVEVQVTQEASPAWGALEETRVDLASTTDIPDRPRPQVTQYRVQVCRGPVCGDQVLICADRGGSHGDRVRLWKVAWPQVANETGRHVPGCHLPPGTRTWHTIEHRLFAQISLHWRGRPLVSPEVMVDRSGAPTTREGLHLPCLHETGLAGLEAERHPQDALNHRLVLAVGFVRRPIDRPLPQQVGMAMSWQAQLGVERAATLLTAAYEVEPCKTHVAGDRH